ncbi:MAG TPA: 50S ribosomal protein L23 [Gammaproteobacteria bacterium]|jgi:large subunit ribosomal protein L23|nr:50S ribosomal protein L23 [Gammaproteobacteria bacterium]
MNEERLMKVLLSPHVSEKASMAKENRQYVFQVVKDATKPEVREAVKLLFKVEVDSVRIVNVKTKPKRFGQIQGRSKAWKKAYVTLREGNSIEFVGA